MIIVCRNQDQDQNPHMFQHSYVKIFELHVLFPPCSVLGMCDTPRSKPKNIPYKLGLQTFAAKT